MIHVEAPAKLFQCDRSKSASGSWPAFLGDADDAKIEETCSKLERHFDGIVLSFANIIRRYDTRTTSAETANNFANIESYLTHLKVPIYVLGIGLQASHDNVWPPLLSLLNTINQRAALFAVRGEQTRDWLHKKGFTNAKALGCPSMFAFPKNIVSIEPPSRLLRFSTAGHITRSTRGLDSIAFLQRIAAETDANYIFQNDIISVVGRQDQPFAFDDATCSLDRAFIDARLDSYVKWQGRKFSGYYFFRDPSSWRSFAHQQDVYLGDRFHGGVAFLQAGRPALIASADERVDEMVAYFDLPSISVAKAAAQPVKQSVGEHLNDEVLARFKDTYRRRLHNFLTECAAVGLEFADREAALSLL
jgi:hypothetical protein